MNFEINLNFLIKPANTQSSSEEPSSKNVKRLLVCVPFSLVSNMQILYLCHRRHRRIHNPLKYLKWSVLRKLLTFESR